MAARLAAHHRKPRTNFGFVSPPALRPGVWNLAPGDQLAAAYGVTASASSAGSVLTLRITGRRHATTASSRVDTPAKPSVSRSPTCSPSHPPQRAPGADGNSVSQRIVLVMRPSREAGMTAWRSDRKLMKIKDRANTEQQ